MHPACHNKKQNHRQNCLLRRTQFWVWKTFSKPASLKRASLVDRVHPTWAGTYILDACVFLFPAINFALIDSDCVPVTLFEIQELWLSCTGHDHPAECCPELEPMPSSPIAPAHKRARSVDTGRATQQPSPPVKLSKSRSVENLAATHVRAPSPDAASSFEDEVDFGGSERRVPSQLNAKN